MRPPFERQHADQAVDAGLGGAGVRLHGHGVFALRRGDRDDRSVGRQQIVAAAEHVEGAVEIDVDHGAESVGAHAQGGGEEVAGGARDHDVERPVGVVRLLHRRTDRAVIAHVGGKAHCARTDFGGGGGGFLGIAARHCDFRAQRGEALGDTKVDAAGAAGDERRFAREHVVTER